MCDGHPPEGLWTTHGSEVRPKRTGISRTVNDSAGDARPFKVARSQFAGASGCQPYPHHPKMKRARHACATRPPASLPRPPLPDWPRQGFAAPFRTPTCSTTRPAFGPSVRLCAAPSAIAPLAPPEVTRASSVRHLALPPRSHLACAHSTFMPSPVRRPSMAALALAPFSVLRVLGGSILRHPRPLRAPCPPRFHLPSPRVTHRYPRPYYVCNCAYSPAGGPTRRRPLGG